MQLSTQELAAAFQWPVLLDILQTHPRQMYPCHTKVGVIHSNTEMQQIYTLLVTRISVHPLPTVWCTTKTWNLVLIIFKVELVVISQLKTVYLQLHLHNSNSVTT